MTDQFKAQLKYAKVSNSSFSLVVNLRTQDISENL